jgi:hypothetical protein
MRNPHPARFVSLPTCRVLRSVFSIFFLLFFSLPSWSQQNPKTFEDTVSFDTIQVKKGTWFRYQGKTYKMKKDTVFVIESYEIPTIEVKSERRTKEFYDSVYKKLSRKKFSQMLYGLAFKPPEVPPLTGTKDKVKSEVPFDQYKGKVIRHIKVETMDPFGTSIYDTLEQAETGVGRALNAAHLKTKLFIIRKNLFIKEGQKVDPFLMADNERNIREMSFIDDVKTYVTLPDSISDSVDITIVTKDVWSIGFDLVTVTPSSAVFRIYDGNFLGLADRLTTNYSLRTNRQPFFRLDGVSYSYNNIAGTFLNTMVSYSQDDVGNQNMGIAFNRNFYSIKTKWAFGAGYLYTRLVDELQTKEESEVSREISYSGDVILWGGRAFPIRNKTIPTRFVITESFFNRSFASRPGVSIDSNKAYYNTTRFLTGLSYSENNYYLTDYIFYFGKTENVPYGKVVQLTMGPEITEFYTRLYGNVNFSAGDFINGFGYLSGSADIGGYLYHKSMEDGILKMSLKYFTPLFMTRDKKFKFRTYYFTDYRYGFNFRKNNSDYTNLNTDLLIEHVAYDTVFQGGKSLSATLSMVLFSPWYFYGFRFAFALSARGGFVASRWGSLFNQRLYAGFGLGIIIRNDNLIFPAFRLSCYYYPAVPNGVPWWQFRFDQNPGFTLPDFNATMPQVETLQN